MIETSENTTQAKWYISKVLYGTVMFLVPLGLYIFARLTGSIPDEKAWWAQGMNHGPWRWEFPGLIIMLCTFVLLVGAVVVAIWGLIRGVRMKDWKPALGGISIGVSYLIFLYVQLHLLYWTID